MLFKLFVVIMFQNKLYKSTLSSNCFKLPKINKIYFKQLFYVTKVYLNGLYLFFQLIFVMNVFMSKFKIIN